MNKYLFRFESGIYSVKKHIFANTYGEACHRAGFMGGDSFMLLNTDYSVECFEYVVLCETETVVLYSETKLSENQIREMASKQLNRSVNEMTYVVNFIPSDLKDKAKQNGGIKK